MRVPALLLLLCPAILALRLHLAREVSLGCTETQHSVLSYANIPYIGVNVLAKGQSEQIHLDNIAIDPQAGNYLILNSQQCDTIGLRMFVGKYNSAHNDTYILYDDARVTMFDIKDPGVQVQSQLRVACASSDRHVTPSVGLDALATLFNVDVEGSNLYTMIKDQRPSSLKVIRHV